jgi:hypothetical protein
MGWLQHTLRSGLTRMLTKLKSLLLGRNSSVRYAVQVSEEEADRIVIPQATIIESWENGDGTVMFIMESERDLRPLANELRGVYGIQRV